jgi:hypothetical protein
MFGELVVLWTLFAPLAAAFAQDDSALPRPVGRGRAYYIDQRKGRDAGIGSEANPWSSLGRANRAVRPGDVVYVQPGRYEGVVLTASGSRDAPITYVSVERHKAVIDRGGFQATRGSFGHRVQIDGSYIVFDGFACSTGWDPTKGEDRKSRSSGAPSAGIATYRTRGVILRNNDCYDNDGWGIFTKQVRDMVIENNFLRRSRREHGLYHADGSTDCVIRGNVSFGNGGCGIQLNQGGADRYVNVLIEGNLLYDNNLATGQSINLDGATDVTIRNNVFIVSRRTGIGLYKADGVEPAQNNVIVNNLFILEKGSRGGILTNNCGTNWIFNNIFWSIGGTPAFNDEGMTLHKQHVGANAGNTALPGENNILLSGELGDLFEDPAEKLFRLKPDAPVIDKGVDSFNRKPAPKTDRDGVPRPQGLGIDIGPYESKPPAAAE